MLLSRELRLVRAAFSRVRSTCAASLGRAESFHLQFDNGTDHISYAPVWVGQAKLCRNSLSCTLSTFTGCIMVFLYGFYCLGSSSLQPQLQSCDCYYIHILKRSDLFIKRLLHGVQMDGPASFSILLTASTLEISMGAISNRDCLSKYWGVLCFDRCRSGYCRHKLLK